MRMSAKKKKYTFEKLHFKYIGLKRMRLIIHLITETHRVVETGRDDASIPLNSGYGSFRSSLDLNVDLCSKNISSLGKNKQKKDEFVAEQSQTTTAGARDNMLICVTGRDNTVMWCHLLAQDDQGKS